MNVQVKPARREIAPAIVATELTTDTLLELSMREIGAIHVKGYYPVDVADRAASRCIDHPKLGHYNKSTPAAWDASVHLISTRNGIRWQRASITMKQWKTFRTYARCLLRI
ncbi:hypothetical protein PUV44_23895 [Xanthomonas arboricola pv. corylina]|nr:hypothetical protein PUV44_23895 [Xanthomonas arboricola pv. corylina]